MPLYRIFPLFCLPEALYTITIQSLVSSYTQADVAYWSTADCSMGGGQTQNANNAMPCGLGWDLVCLLGMAPVYFAITVAIDVLKNYPKIYRRLMTDPVVQDKPITEDDDVAAEGTHLTSTTHRTHVAGCRPPFCTLNTRCRPSAVRVMTAESKANDVVRLVNLRKVYGGGAKAKVAVRGVSLGIQRGEVRFLS